LKKKDETRTKIITINWKEIYIHIYMHMHIYTHTHTHTHTYEDSIIKPLNTGWKERDESGAKGI
jgi:hypothetical protein